MVSLAVNAAQAIPSFFWREPASQALAVPPARRSTALFSLRDCLRCATRYHGAVWELALAGKKNERAGQSRVSSLSRWSRVLGSMKDEEPAPRSLPSYRHYSASGSYYIAPRHFPHTRSACDTSVYIHICRLSLKRALRFACCRRDEKKDTFCAFSVKVADFRLVLQTETRPASNYLLV